MREAKDIILADAIETCIKLERKQIVMKRVMVALAVACALLCAGYIFV